MIRRTLAKVTVAASFVVATAFAAIAQTAPVAPPLEAEKYLPAGKTLAFISVASHDAAQAAFQSTDIGQIWKQLEPFRQELEKGFNISLSDVRSEFQANAGVSLDEAMAALNGGFALGVVDIGQPDAPQPDPAFVLAVPKAQRKTVETALRKAFAPPPRMDPATGQIVHPSGDHPVPYKVQEHGNTVLFCQDTGALAAAGAKTLADDPGYQGLRAKLQGQGGTASVLAYGDIEAVVARAAKSSPKDAEQMQKAGALDAKLFGMSVGFADGRLRETMILTAPGERHGFMKALSAGQPLDLAAAAAGTPADVLSFSAARFDGKLFLNEMIAAVRSIEPKQADELEKGIADASKELGVSLRDDLLGAMGDTFIGESAVPEDGLIPDSIFVFQPKDPAKLEASLLKLISNAGLQAKTLNRGGRKITYFITPLGKFGEPQPPPDPNAFAVYSVLSGIFGAYMIEGGRVYFSGMPQSLEDRMERAAKGKLSDDPAFKQAVAKAPQGARMFGYSRTRSVVGGGYHLMLFALRTLEPMIRAAGIPVDTALLPRASAVAKPMQPSAMSVVIDADGFTVLSQGGVVPILTAIPVLAAIGIPAMQQQQAQANEMRVEMTLRQIHIAQMMHQQDKGEYAKSIPQLLQARALDSMPMVPGYRFVITRAEAGGFQAEAQPMDPSKRHLIVDESGYVRGFGEPNPFAPEPQPQDDPPRGGEGDAPPPDMPPPPGDGEGGGDR